MNSSISTMVRLKMWDAGGGLLLFCSFIFGLILSEFIFLLSQMLHFLLFCPFVFSLSSLYSVSYSFEVCSIWSGFLQMAGSSVKMDKKGLTSYCNNYYFVT